MPRAVAVGLPEPRPTRGYRSWLDPGYPSDETDWTLEISSDVALCYVSIDAPVDSLGTATITASA